MKFINKIALLTLFTGINHVSGMVSINESKIIACGDLTTDVTSTAFALDRSGNFAIFGDEDGTVYIWNLLHKKLFKKFDQSNHGHKEKVIWVGMNNDGTIAASATRREIKIWNMIDQKIKIYNSGKPFCNTFSLFAISTDGDYLVAKHSDFLCVLDLKNDITTLIPNSFRYNLISITEDGSQIIAASHSYWSHGGFCTNDLPCNKTNCPQGSLNKGLIHVWDIKNESIQFRIEKFIPFDCFSFSDNGNVIIGSRGGEIILLNARDQHLECFNSDNDGHLDPVSSVAISHDGTYAISGANNIIKIWDVKNKKLVTTAEIPHQNCLTLPKVAIASNGKYAMSVFSVGVVHIWDVSDKKIIKTFEGKEGVEDLWGIRAVGINGNNNCYYAIVAGDYKTNIYKMKPKEDPKIDESFSNFSYFGKEDTLKINYLPEDFQGVIKDDEVNKAENKLCIIEEEIKPEKNLELKKSFDFLKKAMQNPISILPSFHEKLLKHWAFERYLYGKGIASDLLNLASNYLSITSLINMSKEEKNITHLLCNTFGIDLPELKDISDISFDDSINSIKNALSNKEICKKIRYGRMNALAISLIYPLRLFSLIAILNAKTDEEEEKIRERADKLELDILLSAQILI